MNRVTTVLIEQLALLAADASLTALNASGVITERDSVELIEKNGIYWSGPTAQPFRETEEEAEITWDIWAPSTLAATQIEQRIIDLLHHEGTKLYNGVQAYSEFGGSDRMPGDKDVGQGRRVMTTIIRATRTRAA